MQEPIKIGLLISSFRTGGKENMTLAVLKHLDRRSFDPFLCVMNAGELLTEAADQRTYPRLARFRGDVPGFIWRLFRVLRWERPRVLVCLSYRVPGWAGRVLGWLLRIPVVIYELHGVEKVGERDLEWIDRVLMDRITTHMIAIGSEFCENLLRDGVAAEKITVIRNGVDTNRFAPRPNRAGLKANFLKQPCIGCVTKMRPKKNLPLLIDAFALVRESIPDAQLVIVGDGSERPALEAHIAQKRLQDSVHLLGLRSDIPDLLNAFDVLALSSTTEAAPLSILEAGACGLPVVSTAVGDVPEMIQHGVTGYLVESGDADALAHHLTTLLADANLRATMGAAAREFVEANFSIEASVRARGDLFIRLLEEHAAG